jgi:hypothetical protein
MKTISKTHRAKLYRDLRKLEKGLKELRENHRPRTDPLDAFRNALRPPLEDEPARESTQP